MQTYIPEAMMTHIEETIGHTDFAPYVLDGQTAHIDGGEDDWHDVIVIIDDASGETVMKFTWDPEEGEITSRKL